ncbi:Beta-lactamase_superfamily domain-containing protein [Hexamita inflata]|uniref:Beta-lactamase superfamily domain-containing protein n=1 Tax=Hexamita inflata TaxID=28002 RepID=A0AA86UN57_9EUKA|nr:Beta-lactamase superfamily domain-containing protein [Hexamita inflata]
MSTKINNKFQNYQNISGLFYKNKMQIIKQLICSKNRTPHVPIQTVANDYSQLKNNQFVWFGHSTILFKINDQLVLVDPVFNEVSAFAPHFKYTNEITTDILPEIDILIISHNHSDHLCVKSLKNIKAKNVVVPLNNKQHLAKLFKNEIIQELDWFQSTNINGVNITCTPSQHNSQRTASDKNKSLWSGFVINDVYYTGDTGFNAEMFRDIHKNLPEIKYCFMEMGQYSPNWPTCHMQPSETVEAFNILNGKQLFPIHFGKFCLGVHDWDEPAQLAKGFETAFVGQIGGIYQLEECVGKVYVHESFL